MNKLPSALKAIIVGLCLIALFYSIILIEGIIPRDRATFSACVEQLKHIDTALLEYSIVNDGFDEVAKPYLYSVCHHMIPGTQTAQDCAGEVSERIDNVCMPGTLEIEILDASRYEIRAVAKDKNKTEICVTESVAYPEYRYFWPKKAKCIHSKDTD